MVASTGLAWPTTRIGLATTIDDDGEVEFEPLLGPLHGERLPPYHRLDLRLSRTAVWRGVDVLLFVDAQNVYHRRNIAGYDVSIDEDQGVLVRRPELGAGILPSFGIRFEF